MRSWVVREIITPIPKIKVAIVAPIFALMFGTGALVLVAETGYVAAAGYNVQRLERLKADRENILLQWDAEVATLKSLNRVEQEARSKLKMTTPKEYVYVSLGTTSKEAPPQDDKKPSLQGKIQSLWHEKILPIVGSLR